MTGRILIMLAHGELDCVIIGRDHRTGGWRAIVSSSYGVGTATHVGRPEDALAAALADHQCPGCNNAPQRNTDPAGYCEDCRTIRDVEGAP